MPCAAGAADEPEAVYAKFHRAAASGNLDEMLGYGPAARRAEVAKMSAAQKDAEMKMMSVMMPRAFTLQSKTVSGDGQSARLVVSGPGEPLGGGRPETLYGVIKMVLERGEWKVEEASWSNEKPAGPAQVRTLGSPAAEKAAAKAAPGPAAPAPKPQETPRLGTAKPECVYKPVMTNEDLERCR